MDYQAERADIIVVENGFILTLHGYGSTVTLIAQSKPELLGLLAQVDLRQCTRPLAPEIGSTGGAVASLT